MRRMSVLWIVSLALACAGWAAEGLRPPEAGKTSSTAPTRETTDEVLSVTLSADKAAFGVQEPLGFKLTVKNVSKQAYTFTPGRAHDYWQYHIRAADRDAEYEAYCAAAFEAAPPPFSARLGPGETAVHPVKLGNSFGFRSRRGAPSDTGKTIDSLQITHLPAGKYTMTVAFAHSLVSEETVAGKATALGGGRAQRNADQCRNRRRC